MANNRYRFLDCKEEYELDNLVKNAFLAAKEGSDAEEIINALLTTDEKIKIGRRIQIATFINAQVTGEEIMSTLHVGRNSITLVSKHVSRYPKGFDLIEERRKKVEAEYKKKKYKKSGGSTLVFKKKEYNGFVRKDIKR